MMLEYIKSEVASLRQKAQDVMTEAQQQKNDLEAKAAHMEQVAQSIPAELAQLPAETAAKTWAWIKSLF